MANVSNACVSYNLQPINIYNDELQKINDIRDNSENNCKGIRENGSVSNTFFNPDLHQFPQRVRHVPDDAIIEKSNRTWGENLCHSENEQVAIFLLLTPSTSEINDINYSRNNQFPCIR